MDAVRAADRLLVESVSNDVGQDSFAGQFAENLVGTDRANKDWFLFAIAVNADGTPRSGNGNAGALADRMIAAVGNGVQVVLKDGGYLRTAVSQPVGASASWSGGGWSAAFSSGRSRDARAVVRGVSFSTPDGIGLELTELRERGGVLGLDGGAALGIADGRTTLAAVTARREVAGVALTARATIGSTRPERQDGVVRFADRLVTSAFGVEGARPLLGGVASLGLSSPLRVERARASLLVPVSYDLETGAMLEERRTFDLSPSGREIDLELGWSAALPALSPASTIRLGIARAFDAGHVRGASDAAAFIALAIR